MYKLIVFTIALLGIASSKRFEGHVKAEHYTEIPGEPIH